MTSKNQMLSARFIAAEVASGRLHAQDALVACDQTIAEREDELHVFASRNSNISGGEGPLAGVAIGIKDIFDTRDLPTSYNSPIYADHHPVADAPLVAMLRSAGAGISGKTVTTEFAWFEPGPTRNPHNIDHTPGGSSSGSAAGVAAGFFPAAIGSQTGGSVIRPASFCGVSGYKPSFRLFPTIAMKCYSWSLDTAGFFAATAADNAFVAQSCSGRDLMVDAGDKSAPTIGIFHSSVDENLSDDMRAAWEKTRELAEHAGAKTTVINAPPLLEEAHDAQATVQNFEVFLTLADERIHHNELLSDKLRGHLEMCSKITPETYDNARRTANHARKASHSLFDNCDILLTPSALGAAPSGLAYTGDPACNRIWTLLGMPAVNVAGHLDANQLPLGMQVIAPFGRDKRALQAAHWLEQVVR